MDIKFVDVILPVYNILKFKNLLIKSIQSVINQSYPHWNLIIVDDCSSDGTYEFLVTHLQQLNNDKIRLIRNNSNKGCYVSMNEGILKSSGDYVTRLDSDDFFYKDKLLEQVKVLKNNNIVATYCLNKIVQTKKVTFFNCITLMFRRSIINNIGYYDSVRVGADSEFLDRLVLVYKKRIYGLKKLLYYVNKRPGSLTTSKNTGTIHNTIGRKRRNSYKKRFKQWHKINKKLYIPYPLTKRLF